MKHLFLFELVKKNANIIVYGLGDVGTSYIKQIEETQWCNIIGVSDQRQYNGKYDYYKIEELKKIKEIDYIVIAIASLDIATQVYNQLISFGFSKNMLLNENIRHSKFPSNTVKILNNEGLQIVIVEGGGFGDSLIALILIKRIKELLENKCNIIFFNRYEEYFCIFPEINSSINYELYEDYYMQKFDIVIHMHNIPVVHSINYENVKRLSEQLYKYCLDNKYYFETLFKRSTNNYRFTKYGLLLGKNRIEQLDLHGILGITRNNKIRILINNDNLKCLEKYKLYRKKYFTINRDVGNEESSHPKLWPIHYYQELLLYIKEKYPQYSVVLIGKECCKELISYVDVDLTGKLSLSEVNSILKYGILHIGTEGGMIHLRHFLNRKSMVLFGPTDPDVFGYKENINIFSNECKEHCEWLVDNWDRCCPLNLDEPKCIYSIKPDKVKKIFNKQIKKIERKYYSLQFLEDELYFQMKTKREDEIYNLPFEDEECELTIEIYLESKDDLFYAFYEATRILKRHRCLVINTQHKISQDILQSLNISQDNCEENLNRFILTRED